VTYLGVPGDAGSVVLLDIFLQFFNQSNEGPCPCDLFRITAPTILTCQEMDVV
jgi:hypothetical protein